MKIISLNLNGIRSATTKGVMPWLAEQDADIICLQEVRAQAAQLPKDLEAIDKHHHHWHYAQKPGYSGVGLLSKKKPLSVSYGFGSSFDTEGRLVRADFKDFTVISVYIPSGSSSEERQAQKMVFLAEFLPYLEGVKKEGREVVVCGDYNIAHHKIDLKNWRGNQKNSGFLPEERAWMDELIAAGYRDVFREKVGLEAEEYSWWSNRGNARANNVGWRIDYQMATEGLAKKAKKAWIYRESWFSDHAPVVVEY